MTTHRIEEPLTWPNKCIRCGSVGPGALGFGTFREVDGGIGPDGQAVPASWVEDALCAGCELVVFVANDVVSKAEHVNATQKLHRANEQIVVLQQRNVTGELAAKQRQLDTQEERLGELRVWNEQLKAQLAERDAEIHRLQADPAVIEKERFLEEVRQAVATATPTRSRKVVTQ